MNSLSLASLGSSLGEGALKTAHLSSLILRWRKEGRTSKASLIEGGGNRGAIDGGSFYKRGTAKRSKAYE